MTLPFVANDFDMLKMKQRRSIQGMDKQFPCIHGNCGKSFYDRKNLLRHQTLKHGRTPVWSRPRTRFEGFDFGSNSNVQRKESDGQVGETGSFVWYRHTVEHPASSDVLEKGESNEVD